MRRASSVVRLVAAVVLGAALVAGRPLHSAELDLKVRVEETHGLARHGELVSVPLPAGWGQVRVLDGEGQPVPAQVTQSEAGRTLWFAADVPANQARTYRIVEGEPARPPHPLLITGKALEEDVWIANPFYRAKLHKGHGQLDRFVLLGDEEKEICNQASSLHWNPGVFAFGPERGWGQTRGWNPAPGLQEHRGPLLYIMRRKGTLPNFPEIDTEVKYRFCATEPYMFMESTMEFLDSLRIRTLRNGECVFTPGLVTHAACKDREGNLHEWKLGEHPGEEPPAKPDDEWLAFYHPETGVGLATIRIKVENTGPNGTEPVLRDYHMQIHRIDYATYWARALVWAKGPWEGDEQCQDVPAGCRYHETEAWLPFDASRPGALAEVDETAQRLLHPLKVQIAAAP